MRIKTRIFSPNRRSGGGGPLGRGPNSGVELGREVGESRGEHGRSGVAALVQARRRHKIGRGGIKDEVGPAIKERASRTSHNQTEMVPESRTQSLPPCSGAGARGPHSPVTSAAALGGTPLAFVGVPRRAGFLFPLSTPLLYSSTPNSAFLREFRRAFCFRRLSVVAVIKAVRCGNHS